MKKYLLLSISFCIVSISIWSQNVKIKGISLNGEGKTIELYKDADKFSKKEQFLDSQIISHEKKFELTTNIKYPSLVFIQIQNYSQSFFIEPGKNYEIVIHEFDWNIDEKINIHQNPIALPLEFLNLSSNDLNKQIATFDSVYGYLLQKYRLFLDARFKRDGKRIDTLVTSLKNVLPKSQNIVFINYKAHKIAELEYLLRLRSPKDIANDFFVGKPILYEDEGYTTLFNTFFANYISKGTKKIPLTSLSGWVDDVDLFKYLDSIGVDPILQNEQLRELVALKALHESYYNNFYHSKMVIEMLNRLRNESKFPEHRVIAENIISNLIRLKDGNEVPQFYLPNVDKEIISIDNFKGKWIYLGFVKIDEPSSLCEIEALSFYRDSIYQSGDIEFVMVSCDRGFQKLYHFIKNSKDGQKYNWTWLHFNEDFKLLNNLQVYSFPHFILINPEGKIQNKNTPSPGSGFFINSQWMQKNDTNTNEGQIFPLK